MSEFVFEILNLNTEFIKLVMELNSQSLFYLLIYPIPSVFALFLKKNNLRPIFFFNMFAGFTGVTWFVILFWALCDEEEKKPPKPIADVCKHCNELIRPSSKVCHHCHRDIS